VILITGADGFICSHLVKKFDDVYKIDLHNRNEIFQHDFPWHEVIRVYHMGALSSTTEKNVDRIYDLNIRYSIQLFEEAIRHEVPVTYASSASVYGNSGPYDLNPLNYYALSKATVDYWVLDNIDRFSNIVGCRFFNVYGEGEDHKGNQASPIHQFTKQAKETGIIKVFEGSKNFFRDFVYVGDVIDCITMERPSGIYDVGTSSPISFLYVADLVSRKYEARIETIPFPKHLENKYQWYTCARKHYNKKFINVRNFLELQNGSL